MTTLSNLARMVEKMAEIDLVTTPNVKFINAMIDSLLFPQSNSTVVDGQNHLPFSYIAARAILLKMKIDLSSFDINNPDWKRIVVAYTTLIYKLRAEYGVDGLHIMADQLSITYTE